LSFVPTKKVGFEVLEVQNVLLIRKQLPTIAEKLQAIDIDYYQLALIKGKNGQSCGIR
jgi:hypothetical protein